MAWEDKEGKGCRMEEKVLGGEEAGSGEGGNREKGQKGGRGMNRGRKEFFKVGFGMWRE